jgi:hypothetical protein
MTEFLIGVDSGSRIYLTNTRFSDNIVSIGTVFSDNSTLVINRSRFWREVGFPLRIRGGKATIGENSYRNNTRPALKADGSDITITGGVFRGDLIGGNLDLDFPPKLHGLVFASEKEMALHPDLLPFCHGCSYGDGSTSIVTPRAVLLLIAAVLSAAAAWLIRPSAIRWTHTVWNPKEL